jgi:hypothetical protein
LNSRYVAFEAECRGIVEQILIWCIKTSRVTILLGISANIFPRELRQVGYLAHIQPEGDK